MKITKSRDVGSFTSYTGDGRRVRIREAYVIQNDEDELHARWQGHSPSDVDDEEVGQLIIEEAWELDRNSRSYPLEE